MDKYTIRQLFMYLSNNQYVYCRKCIFTPLRGDLNDCKNCPQSYSKNKDIIWFLTPPTTPTNYYSYLKDFHDYKQSCIETRVIVDFCVWCSLTNTMRTKNILNEFFKTYKNGTLHPSTKLNVIDTMNDLGFFNNNFKLIDEDASEFENY